MTIRLHRLQVVFAPSWKKMLSSDLVQDGRERPLQAGRRAQLSIFLNAELKYLLTYKFCIRVEKASLGLIACLASATDTGGSWPLQSF